MPVGDNGKSPESPRNRSDSPSNQAQKNSRGRKGRRDIPNCAERILDFSRNVPEYLSGAGLEISGFYVGVTPEGYLK